MHFDRNQREMRRQGNRIKLKPNAIPTLFNVPEKSPASLQNENVYTDIVNIPVDEPSSPNPNYVKYKIAYPEMTNVTPEKPTTANLDIVKREEIYDEIEDITIEELTSNHNPICKKNTSYQITDMTIEETTTTDANIIENEVELKKKETSTDSVPKPTTRVWQNRAHRGTKRKRRNNGTFVSSPTTKTLSTTVEVEAENLPTAALTEHLDDNFDTFGKFVASELRGIHSSCSDQVLHRLKKRILNVLFDTWDTIDMSCTTFNTPNLEDHQYSVSNFP